MYNYLQIFALGHADRVEIRAEDFTKLKAAKDKLLALFDFTENYRIVVESYKELERAKYEAELEHILYSKHRYEDSADIRVALSAPVLGYLSTARYFLDSTDRLLARLLGDAEIQQFKALRSKIYDDGSEYRFIEALRNYSQHRAVAVHGTTFHNFIEDPSKHETSDMVTSLSLFADREALKADKKFKSEAVEGMPEKINVIAGIRYHMEGLWRQHRAILELSSATAEAARSTIEHARNLFREKTGAADMVGLYAFAEDDDGQTLEELPLLLDWDDARRSVASRCGNLNNLHRRYVTGKIQTK